MKGMIIAEQSKGGDSMVEKQKKLIEKLTEKFVSIQGDSEKSFVAGYLVGLEEERSKWEKRKLQETA